MRTGSTDAWAARATTPPARPSTRSRGCSGWASRRAGDRARGRATAIPRAFAFPRAWLEPDSWDFSFSGLKTAVRHQVRDLGVDPDTPRPRSASARLPVADLAASFQAAVVDVLARKPRARPQSFGAQSPGAGRRRRGQPHRCCAAVEERAQLPVLCPPPRLCTDNAAMIAAAGYFRFRAGERVRPAAWTCCLLSLA